MFLTDILQKEKNYNYQSNFKRNFLCLLNYFLLYLQNIFIQNNIKILIKKNCLQILKFRNFLNCNVILKDIFM